MELTQQRIKIGDVYSIRAPESYEFVPDDRQERIEVFGGVIISDTGRVPEGDVIRCTAVFRKKDFDDKLTSYWHNRTKVWFKNEAGVTYIDMVFSVKSYKYYSKFPQYVVVTFEMDRARRKE